MRSTPENGIENFSLIDIDAQYHGAPISDFDTLVSKIDNTHTHQKDTFFGIVSDEFIQVRNPKY